jgi:phage shock protein C
MGSQPYAPYGYPPYPTRLVRPIFGRQFAGVCIGLARTYGWDVGVVRIVTVLSAIFIFPVAEIAYIACWIGIPEEQLSEIPPPPQPVPPQQV